MDEDRLNTSLASKDLLPNPEANRTSKMDEGGPNTNLASKDLLPTPEADRTWSAYTMGALYFGCAIAISNVLFGGTMLNLGLNAWQAVLAAILGTTLISAILYLNGVAGSTYGIPHPVQLRSSFGVQGAKVPAVARGIVALFWFGINTWIGGQAVNFTFATVSAVWTRVPGHLVWAVFLFWLLQLAVCWRGYQNIRLLATYGAPVMVVFLGVFLVWGRVVAGTWGPFFHAPQAPANLFIIGLVGIAANWITLSLNVSDFTRLTKSRSNAVGLATGMVPGMFAVVLVGVASASMAVALGWGLLFNPVDFIYKLQLNPIVAILVLIFILVSTYTTNVPANQVAPANALINLWPNRLSFRTASLLVAVVGALTFPWKILENPDNFFRFFTAYGGALGPIVGIMLCDYWILRKGRLNVVDLYRNHGAYTYYRGWNPAAFLALAIGIGAAMTNLDYAWVIGLPVGFILYWVLMKVWIMRVFPNVSDNVTS
jgi:NCS1 family nucleobase:cation symporter-1